MISTATTPTASKTSPVVDATVYIVCFIVGLVPLVEWSGLFNQFATPKFAVLAIGSAALAGSLCYLASVRAHWEEFRQRTIFAMGAYVATLALSTALSVSPMISLQGSITTFTGFSTYLCFAVVFTAVIVCSGSSRRRFELILRTMTATGLIVALVGIGQLIGVVPIPPGAETSFGSVIRIYSTLGHPNFAGNFLIYAIFASEATSFLTENHVWRKVATIAAPLEVLALIFTGTRGAWLGLAFGGVFGVTLAVKHGIIPKPSRKTGLTATAVFLGFAITTGVVLTTTGLGAPIRARIAAVRSEGFTGAGRLTDWKLTLRMAPKYLATGCGLDAFRLAQLPFKTDQYARDTSGVDAEDTHNAYLTSLVSTGLPGLALYCLLIVFAIVDYLRAIRVASSKSDAAVGTVLLAGLCGALIHDFFLHHLLATGLYFFVFLALGSSWLRVLTQASQDAEQVEVKLRAYTSKKGRKPAAITTPAFIPMPAVVALAVPAALAAFYCFALLSADRNIAQSLSAARAGDASAAIDYGSRATGYRLYQTDYHFYFGQALDTLASRQIGDGRTQLLRQAATEFERSGAQSLMPVRGFVYAGIERVRMGEYGSAESLIQKAAQLDSHSYLTHLALADMYLTQNKPEQAIQEFGQANALKPPYAEIRPLELRLAKLVESSDSNR